MEDNKPGITKSLSFEIEVYPDNFVAATKFNYLVFEKIKTKEKFHIRTLLKKDTKFWKRTSLHSEKESLNIGVFEIFTHLGS